jgi:secreted trypsin-like serine protease
MMKAVLFFVTHFLFSGRAVVGSLLDLEDSKASASSPSRALGSRIIGGIVADPKKYPFFTWLNIKLEYSGSQDTSFCGGTLIALDVVMTAAHCLDDISAIDVWVNSTSLKSNKYEYFRKSIRTVVHPKYVEDKFYEGYDIGLIFLDSPVTEVPLVERNRNISLPGSTRTLVTAIGFGRTSFSSSFFDDDFFSAKGEVSAETSDTKPLHQRNLYHDDSISDSYPENLMEATVFSVPHMTCKKRVGSWNLQDSEICAGEGKKGVCYGDSGGPLFIRKGSGIVQIGIISHIYGTTSCLSSQKPQMFTSVAYFATWLDTTVCLYSKSKPSYCSTGGKPSSKPSLKPVSAKL